MVMYYVHNHFFLKYITPGNLISTINKNIPEFSEIFTFSNGKILYNVCAGIA